VRGSSSSGAGGYFRTLAATRFGLIASNDATATAPGAAINATGKLNKGVIATSTKHTAIEGRAPVYGVHGIGTKPNGIGVYGTADPTSGSAVGVLGETTGPTGIGVQGIGNSETGVGVSGSGGGFGKGVYGQGGIGVHGVANSLVADGHGVFSEGLLGTSSRWIWR
jgi:hypothetical protein